MSNLQFIGSRPINDLARLDIQQGNIGQIQKSVMNPETRILTVTTDKGAFDFYAPKLDDPKRITINDMKQAMDKLSKLSSDQDMFADVFLLMSLLFETLKSQRTAAREARNIEREQQVQEIQNQVDKLKTAAATAMAMGFATAAVTLGMAGFSAAKLGEGMKQQFSVNKVEQMQMAKTKLDVANAKVDNLQADLGKARTQLGNADQKVNTLSNDLAKAKQDLAALDNLKPSDMKGKAMQDVQQQRSILESKIENLPRELDAAKLQKAELTSKVDLLSQQLDKAKVVQTDAHNNFERVTQKMDQKNWKLWDKEEQSGGKLKEASLKAEQQTKKVDYLNMANQGISQGMGGLGQGVQGFMQAEATAHEGKARQAEAQAQEQVEWMQEMREAIKSLQGNFQAILQSQRDTARAAMQI